MNLTKDPKKPKFPKAKELTWKEMKPVFEKLKKKYDTLWKNLADR